MNQLNPTNDLDCKHRLPSLPGAAEIYQVSAQGLDLFWWISRFIAVKNDLVKMFLTRKLFVWRSHYAVQTANEFDWWNSTINLECWKLIQQISTKHIFYPNIGGNISEPGQARHKHIVLRAGFLCSADFSCFLPGHKLPILSLRRQLEGGREVGYFCVDVTVSVVQVCWVSR